MKKILMSIVMLGILINMSSCKIESNHTHTLVEYEGKEPTCMEDGYEAYEECTECEYTTYKLIEKLGHNLENDDKNNDYLCDNGCGTLFMTKEKLQKIISDNLSATKVTVKEYNIPFDIKTNYYFDENLLYVNINNESNEKYYFTEDENTYILSKSPEWTKELTSVEVEYKVSYIFDDNFDLQVSNNITLWHCTYGIFEGENMFRYTNASGTDVAIKINNDNSLIEGIYVFGQNNNIIYLFEIICGENKEVVDTFNRIK